MNNQIRFLFYLLALIRKSPAVIDAWVICSDQKTRSFLSLNDVAVNSDYVRFFKLGIRLPEHKNI